MENKYEWKLTDIYKTEADYKKDKERIPELKKVLRENREYLKGGVVNRYMQPFIKMVCAGVPPSITIKLRQILIELKRRL